VKDKQIIQNATAMSTMNPEIHFFHHNSNFPQDKQRKGTSKRVQNVAE
jgi:hypothetical protein